MRHLAHPSHSGTSRGNRRRWMGSAAALALSTTLLAGLAGCGTPSAQQIYDSSNTSKLRDAAMTFAGASTTSASGSSGAISISGDGEIVKKPAAYKLHLVLLLSAAQAGGNVTIDAIEVKSKDYIKLNTSISGLGSFGSDKYTVTNASDNAAALTPKLTNLKLVGEETIRGNKCWHLTGDSKNASGKASTEHLWVRESDYYPVREKLSSLPGVNLPSGTASTSLDVSLTIDYSNYDSGAVINPPPASEIG